MPIKGLTESKVWIDLYSSLPPEGVIVDCQLIDGRVVRAHRYGGEWWLDGKDKFQRVDSPIVGWKP